MGENVEGENWGGTTPLWDVGKTDGLNNFLKNVFSECCKLSVLDSGSSPLPELFIQ